MIPEEFHDIFEKRSIGHMGTLMPNGRIQITPVLVVRDGGTLKVSITRSRQKYRNLVADPAVTLEVPDPENPFHYVEVRGRAEITDDEGRGFIDFLAQRFMGKDRYDADPPGEARVIVTITPERVNGI